MEGKVDVKEFTEYLVQYLRENDLVIAPRQAAIEEQLREKVLRKKWITYKEVADSNIWDVKSKSGVERVVKTEVDPDCIDNSQQPFRIHRSEVERIAKNRGVL